MGSPNKQKGCVRLLMDASLLRECIDTSMIAPNYIVKPLQTQGGFSVCLPLCFVVLPALRKQADEAVCCNILSIFFKAYELFSAFLLIMNSKNFPRTMSKNFISKNSCVIYGSDVIN